MIDEQILVEKLALLKPILAERYHVAKIGYFGSYAKGLADESSDIDILVEFAEPVGWEFFRVQDAIEEILGIRVDLVTQKAIRESMRSRILQDLKWV
ncbi:nucleotidyltransferase family protein [Persicitalea sp.]|uniref:nucleotidyltransferase family protein n=1 Tax=Persicitalea sp. TaxID=3100273 RepID=UPI0035931E2F